MEEQSFFQLCWMILTAAAAIVEFSGTLIGIDKELLSYISLFFNVLWILKSFARSAMIGRNIAITKETKYIKARIKQLEAEAKKEKTLNGESDLAKKREEENETSHAKYFLGFFFLSLIFFFSLLPMNMTGPLVPNEINEEVFKSELESEIDDGGLPARERYSLAYFWVCKVLSDFKSSAENQVSKSTRKAAFKTTRFAIRHPKKFQRLISQTLRYLRWIKYLIPFIATFNKLKENVNELKKMYIQNRQARIALKIRQRVWKKLPEKDKQVEGATRIQKAFRARRAKKLHRSLRIISLDKTLLSIIKIQHNVRTKAKNARLRIESKRKELHDLEERRKDITNNLTIQDKMRTIQLREELRLSEKVARERALLLRPNTEFAVIWQILFVFTVLLEILQLFLSDESGKRSLEDILQSSLIKNVEVEPKGKGVIGTVKNVGRFLKNINPIKKTSSIELTNEVLEVEGTTSFLDRVRIELTHYFIKYFLHLVSTILFMDVFVSFFTGELNHDNGILEPKPSIKRWIAPGVLVQLITNPTMVNVVKIGKSCIAFTNKAGPGRVLRWIISIYPLFSYLSHKFCDLAIVFVWKENKRLLK